jgi:hypothetical protein
MEEERREEERKGKKRRYSASVTSNAFAIVLSVTHTCVTHLIVAGSNSFVSNFTCNPS